MFTDECMVYTKAVLACCLYISLVFLKIQTSIFLQV